MFLAEAFLSSFFEVVLEKLVASPLLEYARRQKVDSSLQEWRKILLQIQAVVNDAEQRQLRDTAVKVWLDDLRALAYDIDDVLDEFDTEAIRRSLVEGPETSTSKVRKLIPSFRTSGLIFNKKISQKIKKISQELDLIVKRKSGLLLREDVGGVLSVNEERLTTSLVDEFGVYGREADKEKIMELVLSDDEVTTTAHKVRVIPIVGMGGIGKTTLAQIVYNDKRVEDNFNFRIWVCVSDRFDLVGITKSILESVTRSSTDSRNLQFLQDNLQKELSGKRFFLVLDDIWNENPNSWSNLQAPLKYGAQGSVIIVTTRHQHVASIMRTTSSHHLSELSDEHCWSLFEHIAFENISADALQNLEPIGRKMIKKCKGLPLAAKTLAGLLRSKQDENAWKVMLNNEIWDLPAEQSGILPALHLSYHYLPTKLKQCFAYCSIFPKDYQFEKEELILLWVAEGLVGGLKREETTLEELGELCFHDLLTRSFFQQSGHNKSLFVMHDLIHDLAQFISGDYCLRLEVGKHYQSVKKARHSSYICEPFDVSKKFDPLRETSSLRTFLPLRMLLEVSTCYLPDKVLQNLLPTLRCLRVLSLSYYNISHLPDSLGNLKQLRYLNLSYTNITKLPKTTGMLLNLQILKLSNCCFLIELPSKIGNLINLRHLDISETKLEGMPRGINRLKDLRRLTNFVVGQHSAASIKELKDLSYLHGALTISNLQNVVYPSDVLEADLKNKKDIDDLVCAWNDNTTVGDAQNQTRVLENLQPHTKLKRLSIEDCPSAKFPNWLGDPSFMNLVSLQLKHCKRCSSLPPLGQLQSLKDLLIVKLDEVRKVGAEFYGNGCGSSSFKPFRSLMILRFEKMMEWKEWVCSGVEFPCLKELYIKECPKLKEELPKHLPFLTKLEIVGCGQLVHCLPMAPSICELRLDECDDVVVRSASQLTSITFLGLNNIRKIPAELGQLHSLAGLDVGSCMGLEELPSILDNLINLQHLELNFCCSLLSLQEMGLPPMLETLVIRCCFDLESLPHALTSITSLKTLEILGCKKLELRLPEDLRHNYYASLTSLHISSSCDQLTSFPLAFFTKLEILDIHHCENLEYFFIPDGLHQVDLPSLQSLNIIGCPNLVRFPQEGLPTPNLRWLYISDCKKLKSLPQQMCTFLTSLECLFVIDCPELEYSFPEGGWPNKLVFLQIRNCNKLIACRKEWGLQALHSLRILDIRSSDETEEMLETFPEEGLLPSTLGSLTIENFQSLKRVDNKGLQHLTSLENLGIRNCEKLKYLPKQGLPSSLSCLRIKECPVLKKRCQRDKGKEWPSISHIPFIQTDEQIILS